jgi:uncharacterized membrane protein
MREARGTPPAAAPAARSAQATRTRVVFVDTARALAVLFMIFGHSLNVLLDPAYQQNAPFQTLLFLRGLTSCTFLLLSGFAFAVASSRYWDAHVRWSRRMLTRLRRFAFFTGLGYTMRFPVDRVAHFWYLDPAAWQTFLTVDILQCIGVTLIALQLLILLTRTERRFALSAAALALLVVLATPAVWRVDWRAHLPLAVAAYLSPATGSLFPLFPWSAFLMTGAALGYLFVAAWREHPERFARRVLLPGGAALALGGWLLSRLPFMPLGPTDFWSTSPNLFLIRLGLVCVNLGVLALLTRPLRHLPRVVAALAHESLLVYFVHILVLYGSAWTPGVQHVLRVPYGPGRAALGVVAMLGAMTLFGWLWNWTKRRHPAAALAIRLGMLGAFLVSIVW